MKISINVPSRGRAGNMETFDILPGALYWVHDYEIDNYKKCHRGIKIKALPDDLCGNVAAVRNYILKNQDGGVDVTVQIDDDVSHFAYWEKMKRNHVKKEREIHAFIDKYSRLARDFGVKLWGINVNNDKQVYREYSPFSFLSYVSASFSCFMRGNELFYDTRFSLKEDYDMTIQQLNKYRRVLRVNKWYYMKKGATQAGGCAIYRNVKREIEQIKLLQKKWGKHIVKFDKNYRNHLTKKKKIFDINPVITIPIRGI